jgi:hypothetical protein
MFDVSEGYVSQAERIRKASPETFEEMKAGKVTMSQARAKVEAPRLTEVKKPAKKPSGMTKAQKKTCYIWGHGLRDPGTEEYEEEGDTQFYFSSSIDAPGGDFITLDFKGVNGYPAEVTIALTMAEAERLMEEIGAAVDAQRESNEEYEEGPDSGPTAGAGDARRLEQGEKEE